MRIVLDTNVSAPARRPARTRRLGRLFGGRPIRLMFCSISTELLAELSRVLRYDRLRRGDGLTDQQIDQHVRDIEAAGVMVPLPADNCRPLFLTIRTMIRSSQWPSSGKQT